MLNVYLAQFQNLIQAPSSPVPLISTVQATVYINAARNQIAAEGECLRDLSTLTISVGVMAYKFTSVVPTLPGIAGPIAVRMGSINGAMLDQRSWEWFWAYYRMAGTEGQPTVMAQQTQGTLGNLVFNPTPDKSYVVQLDTSNLPFPLETDGDVEAIPELWTDAVPFWAAWLGFQSLQRQSDAEMMMARYQVLMRRARGEATPSVLPMNLPGDVGAKIAASKTTLTEAPPPPRGGA